MDSDVDTRFEISFYAKRGIVSGIDHRGLSTSVFVPVCACFCSVSSQSKMANIGGESGLSDEFGRDRPILHLRKG